MSRRDDTATGTDGSQGLVELVIEPKRKDLGSFTVRRVLPAPERKLVGPFIFFDEMGPAQFAPGEGMNVRPHPHIGLATVTYLFEGEILHRDSLGFVQPIEPGAVNLMTAGRGIVHSERTDARLLAGARPLHGIQIWMALPLDSEEIEPAFEHFPASRIPLLERAGVSIRVVIGSAYGIVSPVPTLADTLYLHIDVAAGASVDLPGGVDELGVFVVSGKVQIGDAVIDEGTMGVLRRGTTGMVRATAASRLIVIGGESMGDREIWWNFVSSRRERIEQAKRDWRESRFARVPGDDEFIPLPDDA
jgi:redox-sensitive bicupin YhaK (pirin superfamily)